MTSCKRAMQFSIGIAFHASSITSHISFKFVGYFALSTSFQRYSFGIRSGDCEHQARTLIFSLSRKFLARFVGVIFFKVWGNCRLEKSNQADSAIKLFDGFTPSFGANFVATSRIFFHMLQSVKTRRLGYVQSLRNCRHGHGSSYNTAIAFRCASVICLAQPMAKFAPTCKIMYEFHPH